MNVCVVVPLQRLCVTKIKVGVDYITRAAAWAAGHVVVQGTLYHLSVETSPWAILHDVLCRQGQRQGARRTHAVALYA